MSTVVYKILDEWLPSAVVRGRVFDADGKPLPGVVIGQKLVHAKFGMPVPTTDAEGWFKTDRLTPGEYEFTFGHVRHVVVKRRFTLSTNQEHMLEPIVMEVRPKKK